VLLGFVLIPDRSLETIDFPVNLRESVRNELTGHHILNGDLMVVRDSEIR